MKATLFVLVSALASAQTFDLADVHVSKPGTTQMGGVIPGSGRVEFRAFTLPEIIRFAYGVDDDMITGGPAWLGFDHFDVYAKASRGTSDDTVKLMLRALLADRFKLVFHTVDKPMPAFLLTAGKRVLLKDAAEGEDADCQGQGGGGEDGLIVMVCKNITMASFAERFHMYAGGYVTHPMVDQTGLKGRYDFTLKWTSRGVFNNSGGTSFFDAVDKQLGLKLEEKKLAVPVIVIDSVNETPTPNAPGVKETLPVTETEFEVAEIRLSPPGAKEAGDFRPGGRLDFRATSVKDLLPFVYDTEPNMIVGLPKWVETDKFDIVAKAPKDVSMDAMRTMLRNLFIDRFKIETHKEDQQMPAYVLTAAKKGSKVEKAAGTERAGCKRSVDNGLITLTCKNTSMAQFAEQIHRFAGGYFDHPLVDETGIEGNYDFALTWTPRGRIQGGGGRGGDAPAPAATGVASDPTGGLTVFEAIDRQMGLKVEKTKRPMQVIVVDKMLPPSADN